MIRLDLATAAEWLGGRLIDAPADQRFCGVSTDSRALQPDNLFIALRGERFDGHAFSQPALESGAAAVIVDDPAAATGPRIVVADTRKALIHLGAGWRRRFDIPVIAVTGSNGKTTVKECIAAILRQRAPALATRGNLNNDIGVPLMLCELDTEHAAAVFELGANHPGEIDTLAHMVRPDVGLVTNAAAAHLAGFGSIEGVARAKGELYAALPDSGVAVIAADEPWAPLWRGLAGPRRQLSFACETVADVSVIETRVGVELAIGATRRPLNGFPLPGLHNRNNAAAAAAAAHAAGFDIDTIAAGLVSVEPVPGRLVKRAGPAGAVVLDDSYNANPGSFEAALAVLAEHDGRRWAVVGEMGEMGSEVEAHHRQLGAAAKAAGVARLWAFGPSAAATCAGFGDGAAVVDDLPALAEQLRGDLDRDVALLVKGSRSNRLERLIAALAERNARAGG